MAIVEQRAEIVPLQVACDALGVSRATLYRSHRPPPEPRPARERGPSPRRLDDAERAHILATLHQPEFADQPPAEVYAELLGRGIYLASIRTMYRILAEAGEMRERRHQRPAQSHAKPSLTATAPNQVWTWDITKLATIHKGVFLMAYVIIDLFSRFVVGWMVASKECQHLAAQLFAETIARHGVEPGLQVHADRGAAMKSDTLAQLLASLGVSRSFSRPRVSDDNAFSEAQFKTLKYQPDYPGRFESEFHARAYLQDFFGWHNEEHHHSGLALFTPADVFHGRIDEVRAVRQAALDEAYQAHPERFPHGPPLVLLPPVAVHINPLVTGALTVPPDRPDHVPPPLAAEPLRSPADRPDHVPPPLAAEPLRSPADRPDHIPPPLAAEPLRSSADRRSHPRDHRAVAAPQVAAISS
ncbi:MAG: IS3 family transposase [Alphaproteobacteria bacterium]|nr:IS3 family transposase [Alphaproteobacteria bacterium]